MTHGWAGKGLRVDLGRRAWEFFDLPGARRRAFLGGRGLAVSFLRELSDPRGDALGAEAPLIFAAGPLTGTRTPTSGRHSVGAKSPLTGTIFDANAGGRFGVELKRAGLDCIIITGQAEEPLLLAIEEELVALESAAELWGRNCFEVGQRVKRFHSACCIGRAGEKGVRYANIMHDGRGLAGRGGLGAVMGAKRLKAIGLSGSRAPAIADPSRFQKGLADANRLLAASPVSSKGLAVYGTPVLVNLINYMRLLPTSNFRDSQFRQAEAISGETISETLPRRKTPCSACPIACKHAHRDRGRALPEYETLAMLGPDCDNGRLDLILEANEICNDYGIDTITAGATLACYAELRAKPLTGEEMLALLRAVGEREGIGAELGEGSRRFARARERPELSMTSKGLELPGYDPRGALGLALDYATSNRGACHLRAYMVGPEILGKPKLIDRTSWSGKSGLVQVLQNYFAAVDSLVVCKFATFSVGEEEFANLVSAATGLDYTSEDLLRVGERIWNSERLFNLAAGLTKEDDTLPDRFFAEGTPAGLKPIARADFEQARRDYYLYRGWDEDGVPTPERLESLGLA